MKLNYTSGQKIGAVDSPKRDQISERTTCALKGLSDHGHLGGLWMSLNQQVSILTCIGYNPPKIQ